jgi:DNA/RNA endonuclease YhcR with UshA esterase domain
MKSKYVLAAALSLAAMIAFAQESKPAKSGAGDKSAPLKKIGTLDATNYYNKMMIVTGKVVQVSVRPTITFINLDQPYPKSPFAAIIFPSATNQFPKIKELKGKNVEIKGKVAEHGGKPQIVMNSSNQLQVIETKPTESTETK